MNYLVFRLLDMLDPGVWGSHYTIVSVSGGS